MGKRDTRAEISIVADEINTKLRSDSRYNILVPLLNTGRLLEKLLDVTAKKIGLSNNRYEILYSLILYGGTMKATDLSKQLFRSKQALTQTIDGLEKDGLVVRELKNKDRRVKDIVITKKGIEEIRNALPVTLEAFNNLFPHFTEEESQELINIIEKIEQHLTTRLYSGNDFGKTLIE